MPILEAFIGRGRERDILNSLFGSYDHVCLAICGDVGVGKTSLANVHKFFWKYHVQEKPLFSFHRELEACDNLLNKRNLIIEIIGSVLREINLQDPHLFQNDPLLVRLNYIVDIIHTKNLSHGISGGIAGYSFGMNFCEEKNTVQPIVLATTTLEQHFLSLIDFIKTKEINGRIHQGLIIHVNNFDAVLSDRAKREQVIKFFNEIRDMLQTRDVYFLFLGPRAFFKDIISSQQRVKGAFVQTPIILDPLSKTEVTYALEERMRLLQSPGVHTYIKPVDDEVVHKLYDLYEGDTRSIMSAIRDILSQHADMFTRPLTVDEALILLSSARMESLKNKLTPEQEKILFYLVDSDTYISQKEAVHLFKKTSSNVSYYYFKPLKELEIIEEKKKEGRVIYWGLTKKYAPLKFHSESRQQLEQEIKRKQGQLFL